jgi:hypothetical protein
MKTTNTILFLAIWVSLGLTCAVKDEGPLQTLDAYGIEFRLVTLDEEGEERTVFAEGADVRLVLKAVNHSEDEVLLDGMAGSERCRFYANDQFMFVYKQVAQTLNERQLEPIGRFYTPPINCPDINLPLRVPPKEERIISGHFWSENDNQSLDKGTYYSAFVDEVKVNGNDVAISIEIEFTIK